MFWSPYDYYLNIIFNVCIKCWCFDFFFFQSLDKSKAQCIHDSQYYNILQVAVCKRSNHLTTIVYPLPSLNVSISVTHNTLMLHNAALLYHAAYIYSMLNSQSCTGIQHRAFVSNSLMCGMCYFHKHIRSIHNPSIYFCIRHERHHFLLFPQYWN